MHSSRVNELVRAREKSEASIKDQGHQKDFAHKKLGVNEGEWGNRSPCEIQSNLDHKTKA